MYETTRLILRPWQPSDLKPFAVMGQDPLVMEYFPGLLTQEESAASIERIQSTFAAHGFCFYACELKESGEFIGFVGLSVPNFTAHFTPCVEIGWRIASSQWGHGYATEGALKCLEIGFNEFHLNEIVSFTVKKNYKSINVMQKLGLIKDIKGDFQHPKLADNDPLSLHVLYKINKEQWFHQQRMDHDR